MLIDRAAPVIRIGAGVLETRCNTHRGGQHSPLSPTVIQWYTSILPAWSISPAVTNSHELFSVSPAVTNSHEGFSVSAQLWLTDINASLSAQLWLTHMKASVSAQLWLTHMKASSINLNVPLWLIARQLSTFLHHSNFFDSFLPPVYIITISLQWVPLPHSGSGDYTDPCLLWSSTRWQHASSISPYEGLFQLPLVATHLREVIYYLTEQRQFVPILAFID